MSAQTPLTNDQHYNAGKAYQEIVDRLYTLQTTAGLPEDWVMEQTKQIAADFQNKTGIDLEQF